jgi:glycosyltransferase involved in cell wall biosynthesis
VITFATNVPSFYKTTLINGLSSRVSDVECVFVSGRSILREADFFRLPDTAPYVLLHRLPIETTSVISGAIKAARYAITRRPTILFLSGWDRVEFWVLAFLMRDARRILIVESSIHEFHHSPLKTLLKRLFLSRIHTCIVSGVAHKALVGQMAFKGRTIVADGVGCLELERSKPPRKVGDRLRTLLFLGRLAPEKNLASLVVAMRSCPEVNLVIAGAGPLRRELEQSTRHDANIRIIGPVERQHLSHLFAEADALILPSLSETWGLVCEEAAHFGLPLLVSERAGASEYFTKDNEYGLSFEPTPDGIARAIQSLQDTGTYERLRNNVAGFDLEQKNAHYLEAFMSVLR